MTVDPWTGLSLHDVRFLGERIAYEISVQDQFVAYSGYSSIGQAFYFDDSYQLGASSYQLRQVIAKQCLTPLVANSFMMTECQTE